MTDQPSVEVDVYIIRPSGYDDLVNSDKDMWCLHVINGHAWGWSVRRSVGDQRALNRKGEFVYETRGQGSNRFRRFTSDEAIALAVKFVDTMTINGCTAAQASASVAARLASQS